MLLFATSNCDILRNDPYFHRFKSLGKDNLTSKFKRGYVLFYGFPKKIFCSQFHNKKNHANLELLYMCFHMINQLIVLKYFERDLNYIINFFIMINYYRIAYFIIWFLNNIHACANHTNCIWIINVDRFPVVFFKFIFEFSIQLFYLYLTGKSRHFVASKDINMCIQSSL